jgi:hypothetical protein
VRIIEDRKNGKLLVRRWLPDAAALAEVVPAMADYAAKKRAGVFFGVLPRREEGVGTARDVLPGNAAWSDLDFHDFPGGETECRQKLDAFPLSPSMLVRTGHGLHAYWLMREPDPPEQLVGISLRLASALGGDHVADAARILRMPGTANRKDPDAPLPVTIEAMNLDRRYNPSDFDEILPDAEPETSAESIGEVSIGAEISSRVLELIKANARLRGLFEGRGKPVKDEQGRPLDTTSSGYDFSLVFSLAKKGVTDASELATALWHRPDDAARSKGQDYIARTVSRALERVQAGLEKSGGGAGEKSDPNKCVIDFEVERVRVHVSDPRIYEFTISGVTFRLSTYQILAPGRFTLRYVDAIGRVPHIEATKNGWRLKVNEWLSQAEQVEQPPDAFDAEEQREEIQLAIASLGVGENARDLDQCKTLVHEGRTIFKTRALQKVLKETWAEIKRPVLCSHLRNLGYMSRAVRIDDCIVRVWLKEGDHGEGGAESEAPAVDAAPPTGSAAETPT